MSEYHVVAADGSKSFGTFDKYKPARVLHERLSRKRSVNLLCMHGCGCVYRAIVRGRTLETTEVPRGHWGWRRSEACHVHKRALPMKKKRETDLYVSQSNTKGEP